MATQAIETPLGITVFGSAIMRVDPDIVTVNCSVSRVTIHPKDAFQDVREGAQKVRDFLVGARLTDVGSSRVTLSEAYNYSGGNQEFIGYRAHIGFNILLRELDRLEEILSGLVDAGSNAIDSVELQTTRLKEVRADVRRRAVAAALEKAENYCYAAGVTLGKVIHIEDVNPDTLRGSGSHAARETPLDDEETLKALNPGSINVRAAVYLTCEIGQQKAHSFGLHA